MSSAPERLRMHATSVPTQSSQYATALQSCILHPALQCEINGPRNCSGLFRKGRGAPSIAESRESRYYQSAASKLPENH